MRTKTPCACRPISSARACAASPTSMATKFAAEGSVDRPRLRARFSYCQSLGHGGDHALDMRRVGSPMYTSSEVSCLSADRSSIPALQAYAANAARTPTMYYGDEIGMHDVALPLEQV